MAEIEIFSSNIQKMSPNCHSLNFQQILSLSISLPFLLFNSFLVQLSWINWSLFGCTQFLLCQRKSSVFEFSLYPLVKVHYIKTHCESLYSNSTVAGLLVKDCYQQQIIECSLRVAIEQSNCWVFKLSWYVYQSILRFHSQTPFSHLSNGSQASVRLAHRHKAAHLADFIGQQSIEL